MKKMKDETKMDREKGRKRSKDRLRKELRR